SDQSKTTGDHGQRYGPPVHGAQSPLHIWMKSELQPPMYEQMTWKDITPGACSPPATAPRSRSDISMSPAGFVGNIISSDSLRLIRYSSSFHARTTSGLHIHT